MNSCFVSVIVLTYNPIWEKLKSTLVSIIVQKDIPFEIIISDDGSKVDLLGKVKEFFDMHNFQNYKLIKHKENLGTVNNYYQALLEAEGKFTYGISPGDMLYNKNTLKNLYNFVVDKDIKICFGNAVYYTVENDTVNIINKQLNAPSRPWLFDEIYSIDMQKKSFFTGNSILGATFFRKTDIAIKYVERMKNSVKFVEDNTMVAFLLADNIRIYHYDEYVVWYEYGTGISTSRNKRWEKMIKNDFNACYALILEQYRKDAIIQHLLQMKKIKYKFIKICYLLLVDPMLLREILKIKLMPVSLGYKKKYDESNLENYLRLN